MTYEKLIKKARYFGANIGEEFTYCGDKAVIKGAEIFKEIPELQIFFDRYTKDGIVTLLIELPKEIKNLQNLKRAENESKKNLLQKIIQPRKLFKR